MRRKVKKLKMQFSKRLMVFASLMYAATWVVAVVSWVFIREMPQELMLYTTWMYGSALAVYGGKSAYENSWKIDSEGRGKT